jgi:hypothetical protein
MKSQPRCDDLIPCEQGKRIEMAHKTIGQAKEPVITQPKSQPHFLGGLRWNHALLY